MNSKPLSSQSTGSNTNLDAKISDLVQLVKVYFFNYFLIRITELKASAVNENLKQYART